jgi:hypothetical protein
MKLQIISLFLFFQQPIWSFSQFAFSSHIEIPTSSLGNLCVAADFNDDGLTDLIAANGHYFNSCNLWMYEQQNGQFVFRDTIKYSVNGSSIKGIASGDLNNDRLTDLVIEFADSIKIFFQDSVTHFFNENNCMVFSPDSSFGTYGLACGDLNGDSLCDIAATTWGGSEVYIYYQNPNQTFTLNTLYKRTTYLNQVIISDINNDGKNDIIVSQGGGFNSMDNGYFKNSFAIYVRDSVANDFQFPIFYAIDTITPNSWIVNTVKGISVGDINKDGYKDIVTTYINHAYIWHHIAGSSNFFPNPPDTLNTHSNPASVFIKDINNNGDKEIIICNDGGQYVSIYEPDSTYKFSAYTLVNVWNGSSIHNNMSVEDFNNDSFPDIVCGYSYGISLVYNITPLIGVNDFEGENFNVYIYPNPAYDFFSIKINDEITNAQVEILDLTGKTVYKKQINSNWFYFDNRKFIPGYYFIKIYNNGKLYCGKLMINK